MRRSPRRYWSRRVPAVPRGPGIGIVTSSRLRAAVAGTTRRRQPALGMPVDSAIVIVSDPVDLGITPCHVTNDPQAGRARGSPQITERVPLMTEPNPENITTCAPARVNGPPLEGLDDGFDAGDPVPGRAGPGSTRKTWLRISRAERRGAGRRRAAHRRRARPLERADRRPAGRRRGPRPQGAGCGGRRRGRDLGAGVVRDPLRCPGAGHVWPGRRRDLHRRGHPGRDHPLRHRQRASARRGAAGCSSPRACRWRSVC